MYELTNQRTLGIRGGGVLKETGAKTEGEYRTAALDSMRELQYIQPPTDYEGHVLYSFGSLS